MIRSVAFVAMTVIAPPAPAGAIAMLEVTVPVGAFSVEEPADHLPAHHTQPYITDIRHSAIAPSPRKKLPFWPDAN